MPLKIANFQPTQTAVLNKWADQQENMIQAHNSQITDLSAQLNQLFKNNPTLVKPTAK